MRSFTGSSDLIRLLLQNSVVIEIMPLILSPNSLSLQESSRRYSSIPMLLVTWSSSRLRAVSFIVMERFPRFPARRWKLLEVLSWAYLRSGVQRSSLNSCRTGGTMTRRLIKVIPYLRTLQSLMLTSHCPHIGLNLDTDSMRTVYEKFGLEPGTQDFVGHAMALYLDDE